MTRFARAKGSKASNEKVFEEATSWQEMKNQLLLKKNEIQEEEKRKEFEEKRNANYMNFLKEKEAAASHTEWAQFPNVDGDQNIKTSNISEKSKHGIQKKKEGKDKRKLKKMIELTIENGVNSGIETQFNLVGKDTTSKKLKNKSMKVVSENCEVSQAGIEPQLNLVEQNTASKKLKKKFTKVVSENCEGSQAGIEPELDLVEQNTTSKKLKKKFKKLVVENCMVSQVNGGAEIDDLVENSSTVTVAESKNTQFSETVSKKLKKKFTKLVNGSSNVNTEKVGKEDDDDDSPVEVSSKIKVEEPKVKKVKQKKKKLKIGLDSDVQNADWKGIEASQSETIQDEMKPKLTLKEIDLDSLPEDEKKKLIKKLERRKRQVEKKKLKKQQKLEERENSKCVKPDNNTAESRSVDKNTFDKPAKKFDKSGKFVKPGKLEKKMPLNKDKSNGKYTAKKEKLKDGEFKRRKNFQPNKMMINGKEVDIEYFDGFPIKKEDAQNLKKLRKEMVSKGLPRSEINTTMKLERRKAEKALTREKKKVCFNCRKFGHNLSECPELSNENNKELVDSSGTGICFKCGSTEHTSFVCRVVHGQDFKFATCFICKEQGHISRQCPDNARGLYPKGGSCKICGDVTHLKRDCPQFVIQQEKEQGKFQVETISEGNPDDLGDSNKGFPKIGKHLTKPNKVIKF